MPVLQAIVLGIVQGLTEFLPISSSGHLVLVPELFEWTDLTERPSLNKAFDVALHLGTLLGAAWYFRRDIARYAIAALRSLQERRVSTTDQRVAWLLVLSSVPAALVGALAGNTIEEELGNPILIGAMLVVFGLVLFVADRLPQRRAVETFRTRDAITMGVAQAVALQPGVSRAGVTISTGRWLGLDRESATRISFLMSLPIIAGAGLYKGVDVVTGRGVPADFVDAFVWGTVASAVSGFLAIFWLLRYLRTRSFAPFVAYRVVVGIVIVVVFSTGLR